MLKDLRDLELSGATPAARDAFERALDAHLSWRSGADAHLEQAVRIAPTFTMAHVLSAYFNLCSRDQVRVHQARGAYLTASKLPANPRERLHVAAMGAVLADDLQSFGYDTPSTLIRPRRVRHSAGRKPAPTATKATEAASPAPFIHLESVISDKTHSVGTGFAACPVAS